VGAPRSPRIGITCVVIIDGSEGVFDRLGVGVPVEGGGDSDEDESDNARNIRRARRWLINGNASSMDWNVAYSVMASFVSCSSEGKLLCRARGLGTSSNKGSSSGTVIEARLSASSCQHVGRRSCRNIGEEGSMI
jgi:hypothetical protein